MNSSDTRRYNKSLIIIKTPVLSTAAAFMPSKEILARCVAFTPGESLSFYYPYTYSETTEPSHSTTRKGEWALKADSVGTAAMNFRSAMNPSIQD